MAPSKLTTQSLQFTLNQFFKTDLQQGRLDFLRNRTVKVVVSDIQLEFIVTLNPQQMAPRLKVIMTTHDADILFRGNMDDLFLLITQKVDPDTLFFRRKLMLIGDTELGLELKNYLDTIELQARLPKALYDLSEALAEEVLLSREARAQH
ncbi:MAG: SCP2 sterol-binding domain-containing protein [Aliidiomarina sp.]|uniref:ubiquinone anaerobic biosynthesis accessory factor UbiT n=1 Tax=Aliidiomarina sp. TaxID=1872439 RepID=UPI0025C4A0FC|nr:SCP2 sterol-binding domain-containing protein [Aliidiomarina sp.]MCH8501124.1 SCP2 sterol-binding domain-containing protein [Aliidiomarina sp.]